MEPRNPRPDGAHPVPGPHGPSPAIARAAGADRPPADLPPGFVPLRLVLQPSGTAVEVDRPEVLIGRHSDADLRLPLPDVSRRHCRLEFVEGCWQVIDLHSL